MMRIVTAVCVLFCLAVVAPAVDVDALLSSSGSDFKKALDAIASDSAVVSRLRASPFPGSSSVELRRELMRNVVLAKVDTPDLFSSFDAMVSMIRPDSPMRPSGWWDGVVISQRVAPDESMMRSAMEVWHKSPPANADEWVKLYREVGAMRSLPDEKHMSNRYWPMIVFGLTGEPAHLRPVLASGLFSWCEVRKFDDLSLESVLFLCERTGFDQRVTKLYRTAVYAGVEAPGNDRAELITRALNMLELGERFIQADNRSGVNYYIDKAEALGAVAQVTQLRRLADMPIWSAYRDRMLQVAEKLEKVGDKPKEK